MGDETTINCRCGESFTVPSNDDANDSSKRASGTRVACPSCGAQYDVTSPSNSLLLQSLRREEARFSGLRGVTVASGDQGYTRSHRRRPRNATDAFFWILGALLIVAGFFGVLLLLRNVDPFNIPDLLVGRR